MVNCLDCCHCKLQFISKKTDNSDLYFYECFIGTFTGKLINKQRLCNCEMFNKELSEEDLEDIMEYRSCYYDCLY